MRTALRPLAPLLVLALVGCGGNGSSSDTSPDTAATADSVSATDAPDTTSPTTDPPAAEPPATEPPATDPPVTDPPTPDGPNSDIVLVDAGAEPRSPLRLTYTSGTFTSELIQTQEFSQSVNGAPGQASSVATRIVTEADVASDPEGFAVTTTVTEAGSAPGGDPAQAAAIDQTFASLVGVRTLSVIDDRGMTLQSELDQQTLTGVPPQIAATLDDLTVAAQMSIPMPEEAVGPGAVWRVDQFLSVNGIEILQTTEIRLVSIDGTMVTVEATATQTPTASTFELPGPTGAPETVEIVEWTSLTNSTVTFDLASPITTSRSTTSGAQVLRAPGPVEIDQEIRITNEVTWIP